MSVTRLVLKVLGSTPTIPVGSIKIPVGALYLDLAYEQDDDAIAINPILINAFPYHQEEDVPASDALGSHAFKLTVADITGVDGLKDGNTTITAIIGYLSRFASPAIIHTDSSVVSSGGEINVTISDQIAMSGEMRIGIEEEIFDGSSFASDWNTSSSYIQAASDGGAILDEQRFILIRDTVFTSLQNIEFIIHAETDNVSPDVLDTSYYFTIEDLTPPLLDSVHTRGLRQIRVKFNEAMLQGDDVAISTTYVRNISGGFEMTPADDSDPTRIVAYRDVFTSADVGLFLGVAGANNALNNDIFKIVSVISPRIAELAVCGTYPESLTILMQETLPQEATITISPYRVEGVPDAALVSPYFEPIVISAEYIADDEVELTLNDDITQNREYVFHAYGVEDLNENTINDNASFTTEGLDIPVSRINGRFDYANLLPYANQRPEEDGTKDLERFIKCIDEVLQLILHSVDTFPYIMDPNLISDNNLDALLAHLGAPFSFVPSLEEVDKRRLAAILVDSYKIKGTELGIEAMISYVLGITVNIQPFYDIENLWVLGESMLGVDTILGPGSEFLKYSFEVITDTSLTEAQRRYITEIVEWMKPCHTHFVRLREPGIAIELNDNIIAFDSVVVELPMEANISDSISTVDEIALSGDVLDMVLPLDTITEMVDEVVLGGVLHKVFSNSISVTDQISVIVIET